jgi:prepilin-type processing-associated H-X9-DG protein
VELLVSIAILVVLVSLLLPAVQAARESARRAQCQSHLRQIGLGLHSFYGVHQVFPAAGWTMAGPGNPHGIFVGWRALVLPHLEQAAMFDQYDFSVDWWHPRNAIAGTHDLPLFRCPSTPSPPDITVAVSKPPRPAMQFPQPLARSDYAALMGVNSVIDPELYATRERTRAVMHRNSTVRIADILDGTSHTLAVSECSARPAVYRGRTLHRELSNDQGYGWIDSESGFSLDGVRLDDWQQGLGPQRSPRGINATNENEPYSFHAGGAYFLFADGHVSFISQDIPLQELAALATRAAGEIVMPR